MDILIVVLLKVVDIYSFILLAYAFLSWFPGLVGTRIGRLVDWLAEPILAPFRRWNLIFMGMDFTVLVVTLLLNAATRILIYLLGWL